MHHLAVKVPSEPLTLFGTYAQLFCKTVDTPHPKKQSPLKIFSKKFAKKCPPALTRGQK